MEMPMDKQSKMEILVESTWAKGLVRLVVAPLSMIVLSLCAWAFTQLQTSIDRTNSKMEQHEQQDQNDRKSLWDAQNVMAKTLSTLSIQVGTISQKISDMDAIHQREIDRLQQELDRQGPNRP